MAVEAIMEAVLSETLAAHGATGGALLFVMREMLEDRAPKNADRLHAEGILRLLGLSAEDAAEVARRPMPKIPSRLPSAVASP